MLKLISIVLTAYLVCVSFAQEYSSPFPFQLHNSLLTKLPISTTRSKYNPIAGTIVQNLDNFDPQNSNTFKQVL